MTLNRTITVRHDGQTYNGEIMTIKSTSLGYSDHGILSAWLHCATPGRGVGVGGFCLDEPRHRGEIGSARQGTAYGLDFIIRVLETVGAESWERLPGADIVVLYAGRAGWGGQSIGIAGLHTERVLLLKEHADEWRLAKADS